jgi:plasmid stability protein
MFDLTIADIPSDVYEALCREAATYNLSVEEHARQILIEYFDPKSLAGKMGRNESVSVVHRPD